MPSPRSHALDGLRALAAAGVVAVHLGFDTGVTFRSPVGAVLARGDLGVPVFFVLSGYLLYQPFAAAHLDGTAAPAATTFWWRRATRVLPAYWLVLTVAITVFGVAVANAKDALLLYGLAQIYRGDLALAGLPQAWSLCVEASFYAVLPVWAFAIGAVVRRRRAANTVRIELVGLLVLAVGGLAYRVALYALDPAWKGTALFWLPAHIDLFAAGMALAVARVAAQRREPIAAITVAARHPAMCAGVALACFAAICFALDLPRGIEPVPAGSAIARQALALVMSVALVVLCAMGPAASRLRAGFALRPVAWVGMVSYGVYLWHKELVFHAVRWTGGEPTQLDGDPWAVLAVAMPLTLLASWLTHVLLEAPIARRTQPRVPGVASGDEVGSRAVPTQREGVGGT